MFPKLHFIKFLVHAKYRGRERLCNGLLVVDEDKKIHIYVSTCYNKMMIMIVLFHELYITQLTKYSEIGKYLTS